MKKACIDRKIFCNDFTDINKFIREIDFKISYCAKSRAIVQEKEARIRQNANGDYNLFGSLWEKSDLIYWTIENNWTPLKDETIESYVLRKREYLDLIRYIEFKSDDTYLYCISYKDDCISVERVQKSPELEEILLKRFDIKEFTRWKKQIDEKSAGYTNTAKTVEKNGFIYFK